MKPFIIALSLLAFIANNALCGKLPPTTSPEGTVKVVAYLYDYKAEKTKWIMTGKNKLHTGVIKKYTQTLNKEDVAVLLNALTEKYPKKERSLCEPTPHHAIVFYDKNNLALASISICFQCKAIYSSEYKSIRKRLFSYRDIETIQKLFKKNEFPILKNDTEYANLTANPIQIKPIKKANKMLR